MTALDLLTRAMVLAGIWDAEGAHPGPEANQALISLNSLLETLRLQGLTVHTITRTTRAIIAAQASYTIGTGGDIVVERPVRVDRASLLLTTPDPDQERQLDVLLQAEWEAEPCKTLTGTEPQRVYYNPTYPLGTLYVWPIPTAALNSLVLYLATSITAPTALTTVLSLPPGYERMLRSNLTLDLCAEFQRPVDPNVQRMAIESLAWVKRANRRPALLRVDPALTVGLRGGGSSNIRTGEA